MRSYPVQIEESMKKFYESLTEKDQRRYAGIEALKLGRGGVAYLSRVLGCSRKTVLKGLKEVQGLTPEEAAKKNGSGRPGVDASAMMRSILALMNNF